MPANWGFTWKDKLAKERLVERSKRLRVIGDLPPVYPNGWFCIGESYDLKNGELKPIVFMGRKLVLFRAEKGTVHLTDSYCPHMGANLGVGGRVVDNNCIQCPFHGWTFSGITGKCTNIPYSPTTKVPESAKVQIWNVVEKSGHIYAWYHCDGADPEYEVPAIDEVEDGRWTYKGRAEYEVLCHIEEIPENVADSAHFTSLHSDSVHDGSDITEMKMHRSEPALKHSWRGHWEPDPEKKHISRMTFYHNAEFMGLRIPVAAMKLTHFQPGPGIVYLYMKCAFGKAVIVQTFTPEEPMFQRMRLVMYGDVNGFIANVLLQGTLAQLERDIYIWSNKRYVRSPLYCKDDGPIARHRRWYAQFYSENSPRLNKDGSLTDGSNASMDW
ncbi:Protein DAF-36 [Aphelenchoides avenae]|nr:Protein DAF-36 [Aphelenchus avenae]